MKRALSKSAIIDAPPSLGLTLTMERGPHRGLLAREVKRRLTRMIEALQLDNPEVSFVLTDDARIHDLNKVYRHKDRPTDVLAFAMREGEFADLAGASLGDVIVSVPTARKQAAERSRSVLDEVTMLLAHGLLHLLGWDHDTASQDRRMRAETDRLCLAAGPPRGRSVAKGRAAAAVAKPAASRSKRGAERSLSLKRRTRKR